MPTAASTSAPEQSREAMVEYVRTHLPAGIKPGDFLTAKRDYPTGDTADVYRAVLDTLYITKEGWPSMVVLSDVADPLMAVCSNFPCPLVPPDHTSQISEATIESFRLVSLTRRHITPRFRYRLPLKLLGAQARKLVEEDGRYRAIARLEQQNVDHPFWVGFAADYPGAWGYAAMTAVGMNPEKTEALLQVRHHCGGNCYSVEVMLARKIAGKWRIVERMPEQADSLDRGEKSLHFRGVGAGPNRAELRAAAVGDSLKKDRLPRDIKGALTKSYGGPIVGAAVTAASDQDPNKPWTRVISDAGGAYVIKDPPLGSALLTVHCPQGTRRPDGLMAVSSVFVEPAKPITFNMSIDPTTCDDPAGTPQGIQPPFDAPPLGSAADSARARNATYPSDEEAAVYRAVLSAMGGPTAGKIVLIYATTKSACHGTDCNDEYNRRIRFEPDVMLATMENFLSVREKKLDLKDGFTGLPYFVLIGDSTLKAVETAAGRMNLLDNWSLLHLAWPTVERVVQLSPVAFSPHHKQAMVEVTRGDVDGLSKSELWFVEPLAGGDWRVVTSIR